MWLKHICFNRVKLVFPVSNRLVPALDSSKTVVNCYLANIEQIESWKIQTSWDQTIIANLLSEATPTRTRNTNSHGRT